jgi:hypothetical protein
MNTLGSDLWWVAGGALLLIVLWFVTRMQQRKRQSRRRSDPRSSIINKTNYNIDNTGIDGEKLADLDEESARQILDSWKGQDYIPSDAEFRRVQRAIRQED